MKGLDCLQLLHDGEREGLGCLYKLFAEDLYRYGLSIAGDEQEVEEVLHDFFVYIWESRDKFGNVENPQAYLMISFKRRLIKKLGKNQKFDELDYKYDEVHHQESEEEIIIRDENEEEYRRRIKDALQKISDREREVIHLKYFEKYKNEEIAEILEMKNQSVRNLLYRAIQNLRRNL